MFLRVCVSLIKYFSSRYHINKNISASINTVKSHGLTFVICGDFNLCLGRAEHFNQLVTIGSTSHNKDMKNRGTCCPVCWGSFYKRHCVTNGRKEMFHLTTHSIHFIYGYMASDIW